MEKELDVTRGIFDMTISETPIAVIDSACLLPDYLSAMRSREITTFEGLYQAGSHKYLQSFLHKPL